jgi:hypothetical protein
MKRISKRILLGSIAAVVGVAIAAWVLFLQLFVRPATYQPTVVITTVKLRSWPEHDAIYRRTPFPYVLRLERGPARILYIGARHTSDAADPQLAEVERLWAGFQPTVALCEGRARTFRFASRPATGTLHESELVRILAQRDGVPLYSLEPAYEAEVNGLLRQFEPRLVATYLTLRVFTSEARGYDGDRDGLARHLLRKRTDVAGLRGSLSSIDELDAYWRERFPAGPDWRALRDTESMPLLVEVGHLSREIRGEHMVRALVDLAARGEHVLAVVGASHVIRQELALGKALEEALAQSSTRSHASGEWYSHPVPFAGHRADGPCRGCGVSRARRRRPRAPLRSTCSSSPPPWPSFGCRWSLP